MVTHGGRSPNRGAIQVPAREASMESRYSVRWMRRDGGIVPIETMSDVELAAARGCLDRDVFRYHFPNDDVEIAHHQKGEQETQSVEDLAGGRVQERMEESDEEII